jgi:putative glutamine amidotransferase
MTKPLIGIPTRSLTLPDDTLLRYAGLATYIRAIEIAGGAPLLIPLGLGEATLRAIFNRLDGLLMQGGVDVHPQEYGEPVQDYCGEIDPARDTIELELLRWAFAENKPTLGICRGIQMMNVAAGGSLYQDIPAQLQSPLKHQHVKGNPYDFLAHNIELEPTSRLARALGATKIKVNSLHHQSLKRLAPGFHVVARAPDGVIEGIESDNQHFAVGVQFHPEWMIDADTRMIGVFKAFVQAVEEAVRSHA